MDILNELVESAIDTPLRLCAFTVDILGPVCKRET
jgi:hypothetical protein